MTDHTVDANEMVRAEFEEWAKAHDLDPLWRDKDGRYVYWESEWSAYQAATQRQQERIAELEAQVQALSMDAGLWRYSVAIGGNQSMNWLDVYDDWDGEGDFADAIKAAIAAGKGEA